MLRLYITVDQVISIIFCSVPLWWWCPHFMFFFFLTKKLQRPCIQKLRNHFDGMLIEPIWALWHSYPKDFTKMGEKHFDRNEENDQFLELLAYDYPEQEFFYLFSFFFLQLPSTIPTCMRLHARQGCFENSVEYISTTCWFPLSAGGAWIFQMEGAAGQEMSFVEVIILQQVVHF